MYVARVVVNYYVFIVKSSGAFWKKKEREKKERVGQSDSPFSSVYRIKFQKIDFVLYSF
jgi:hypothetical protein